MENLTRDVIICLKNAPSKEDTDVIVNLGGNVKRIFKILRVISAKIPESVIEKLKRNPNVESVEIDEKHFAHIPIGTCQEIKTLGQLVPWGVNKIGARTVQTQFGNKGKGMKIGILDTGVDYLHEDLKNNYKGGYNFVAENKDPMDDNAHGTHVAGIIAAEDNDIGVVGVAPEAYIYSIKVLDFAASGSTNDILAGMEWSIENEMQIINMSLGSTEDSKAVRRAVNIAYDRGMLIVAAAGNTGNAQGSGESIDDPARYSEAVIAVGATDINNKRAKFSSTGSTLEISAPGVDITSTLPRNKYGILSGTCLTGDSLVILEDGVPVNISDIVDGDIVISWDNGKIIKNKVSRVIKNGKRPIYMLKLKGRYIKCTENHPFLISDKNNEYNWKELKDINVGDYIWCLNMLDDHYFDPGSVLFSGIINDISSNLYVKLTEKGQSKIMFDSLWYSNLRKRNYFKEHTSYAEGTIRSLVKRRNGMKLKEVTKLFKFIGLSLEPDDYLMSNSKDGKNIILPNKPDTEFCKLFGYMIGNGWISQSKDGNNQVSLSIGYDENGIKEFQLEYVFLFEKLFNTELKIWDKTSLYYYCFSANIHEFLKRLGLCKYAKEKQVPEWIFKLNKELKINFIEGLFSADGHRIDNNRTVIELSSKKLIDGIVVLCSEIGLEVSGIGSRERKYRFMRESGKVDQGVGHSYSIVVRHNYMDNAAFKMLEDKSFVKEDTYFVQLEVKSKEYYGEDETYDIEIENSHNFISNGIVVHNSMSSPHVAGVLALIKFAHPELTNVQTRVRMQITAQNIGKDDKGYSSKSLYGYGLVDALRSVTIL